MLIVSAHNVKVNYTLEKMMGPCWPTTIWPMKQKVTVKRLQIIGTPDVKVNCCKSSWFSWSWSFPRDHQWVRRLDTVHDSLPPIAVSAATQLSLRDNPMSQYNLIHITKNIQYDTLIYTYIHLNIYTHILTYTRTSAALSSTMIIQWFQRIRIKVVLRKVPHFQDDIFKCIFLHENF